MTAATAQAPPSETADPSAIAAIADPVERAHALSPILRDINERLPALRHRRNMAVLTLTREWDEATRTHSRDIEALLPESAVRDQHAATVRRARRDHDAGRLTDAGFERVTRAADNVLAERLAASDRRCPDWEAFRVARVPVDDAYRAAKAAAPYKPADVARLIGKSRSLLVRIRDRAAADAPRNMPDAKRVLVEANAEADRLEALMDALRPIRNDTVFDMIAQQPSMTNVQIGALLDVEPQRITQLRTGVG